MSHITDTRTGADQSSRNPSVPWIGPQNIETIKRAWWREQKGPVPGIRRLRTKRPAKPEPPPGIPLMEPSTAMGGVKRNCDHAFVHCLRCQWKIRIALAIPSKNGGFPAPSRRRPSPAWRLLSSGQGPAGAAGEDAAAVENDNDEE